MIKYFCICFLALSAFSSLLAIDDKRRAKNGMRRISERTLILAALSGGALAEYITMKCIRHKTLHKKFMIGLPLIFLLHLIIIIWIVLKVALN